MSVSDIISSLIKSNKKFTQKGMAESIGVPPTTVNNWIKLGRDIPADLIIPICEYFGVSCNYLLTGSSADDSLTSDEMSLIEEYRKLSKQQKRDILGAIRIQLMMDGAADQEERLRQAK